MVNRQSCLRTKRLGRKSTQQHKLPLSYSCKIKALRPLCRILATYKSTLNSRSSTRDKEGCTAKKLSLVRSIWKKTCHLWLWMIKKNLLWPLSIPPRMLQKFTLIKQHCLSYWPRNNAKWCQHRSSTLLWTPLMFTWLSSPRRAIRPFPCQISQVHAPWAAALASRTECFSLSWRMRRVMQGTKPDRHRSTSRTVCKAT